MNKNTLIAALVIIVLVGLGLYFFKDQKEIIEEPIVNNTNTDTGTITPTPVTETREPSAPVVQTSANNATSSSTAIVNGNVKPNGASTTYWFEYGDTQALGSRVASQAVGSGFSLIPATGFISGLRANTSYFVRLSAQNKFGTVNGEVFTFKTNNTVAPKISLPTARTNDATKAERTTAILNGEVNPNGSATNYWFEYGTDTNFGDVTTFQATNSGTSYMKVPTTVSNLKPATKYYFRLNAQNQFGTVNGSTKSFTTLGPALASEPTVETSQAKNITSSEVVMVGRISPNRADTSYWFEYSTDSLLGSIIGTGTLKGTISADTSEKIVQTTVKGLQPNTKYYYYLVGQNQEGTVNGKVMSFTTKK